MNEQHDPYSSNPPDEPTSPTTIPTFLSNPHVCYPNAYVWLVLVSSLDLMLTMLVLYIWDGYEVNPVAEAVIAEMGYIWAIVFKFAIIVLVVIICEYIGRRDIRGGRSLAVGAVIINSIPVAYTFTLLIVDIYFV